MASNPKQIITMEEATQDFSKVISIADQNESAVIFKNNKPKYVIVNVEQNPVFELSDDEKIDVAAKRIFEKYRAAFEELAK